MIPWSSQVRGFMDFMNSREFPTTVSSPLCLLYPLSVSSLSTSWPRVCYDFLLCIHVPHLPLLFPPRCHSALCSAQFREGPWLQLCLTWASHFTYYRLVSTRCVYYFFKSWSSFFMLSFSLLVFARHSFLPENTWNTFILDFFSIISISDSLCVHSALSWVCRLSLMVPCLLMCSLIFFFFFSSWILELTLKSRLKAFYSWEVFIYSWWVPGATTSLAP